MTIVTSPSFVGCLDAVKRILATAGFQVEKTEQRGWAHISTINCDGNVLPEETIAAMKAVRGFIKMKQN